MQLSGLYLQINAWFFNKHLWMNYTSRSIHWNNFTKEFNAQIYGGITMIDKETELNKELGKRKKNNGMQIYILRLAFL